MPKRNPLKDQDTPFHLLIRELEWAIKFHEKHRNPEKLLREYERAYERYFKSKREDQV